MKKSEQMFFDGQVEGYDSFLGEVIQIFKVDRVHFDIDNEGARPADRKARVEFQGVIPGGATFWAVQFGYSYGECLRKIREQIRMEVNR